MDTDDANVGDLLDQVNGAVPVVAAGVGGGAAAVAAGRPIPAKRMKVSHSSSGSGSGAGVAGVRPIRSRTSHAFKVVSPFGPGNIRTAKHKHYINALSNYTGYDRVGASAKQRALWNKLSTKLQGPAGRDMRAKAIEASQQAAANRRNLYNGLFSTAKQQRILEQAAGLSKSSSSAAKRHYFKATMGNNPAGPYDIATFLTGKGRAKRVRPAPQEMLKAIMKQAVAKGVTFNTPSQFFHLLHTFTNANSARYNESLGRNQRLAQRLRDNQVSQDDAAALAQAYDANTRAFMQRNAAAVAKRGVIGSAASAAQSRAKRVARRNAWQMEKSAFGKVSAV